MTSRCSLDYSASNNGSTIDCSSAIGSSSSDCAVSGSVGRRNSDNSVTNTGPSSIGTRGRGAGLQLTCAAAELCWPCSLWLPVQCAVLLLLHGFGAAAAQSAIVQGRLAVACQSELAWCRLSDLTALSGSVLCLSWSCPDQVAAV